MQHNSLQFAVSQYTIKVFDESWNFNKFRYLNESCSSQTENTSQMIQVVQSLSRSSVETQPCISVFSGKEATIHSAAVAPKPDRITLMLFSVKK